MPELRQRDIDSMRATSEEYMPFTCNIFRVSQTTDTPIGKADAARVQIGTNIICDILSEQVSSYEASSGGRRSTVVIWNIFLPVGTVVDNDCVIVDNTGREFKVNNVSDPIDGRIYSPDQAVGVTRIV